MCWSDAYVRKGRKRITGGRGDPSEPPREQDMPGASGKYSPAI